VDFTGSYLPLPVTRAERESARDPRPSIEERYRTRADYIDRYTQAAAKMVMDGYLLSEDLQELINRGGLLWDYATRARNAQTAR
jgi:alpha/beta hydrolase family protein